MGIVRRLSAAAAICVVVLGLAACGSTPAGSESASPSSSTIGPDPRLTFPEPEPGEDSPLRDELVERIQAVGTEVVACVGGEVSGSGAGFGSVEDIAVADANVLGSEGSECRFAVVEGAGTMDEAIATVAEAGMDGQSLSVVDEAAGITHAEGLYSDGESIAWSFTPAAGNIWAVGTTSGFATADALLELIAP